MAEPDQTEPPGQTARATRQFERGWSAAVDIVIGRRWFLKMRIRNDSLLIPALEMPCLARWIAPGFKNLGRGVF